MWDDDVDGEGGNSSSSAGQAGGLIGGILGGVQGFYQPFIQQNWAGNATRSARHWAQYMAKHQYQFAVKDLERAGLNPALAYTQGGNTGMNVPPQSVPSFDTDGDVIGRAVAGAKAGGALRDQLKIIRNEAAKSDEVLQQEKYRTLQEYENVFKNQAASAKESEQATIFKAQREILLGSKKEQTEQYGLQNQRLKTELELQRAKLPNADALRAFDASPEGRLLIQLKHGAELSPKFKGGFLGTFGVD